MVLKTAKYVRRGWGPSRFRVCRCTPLQRVNLPKRGRKWDILKVTLPRSPVAVTVPGRRDSHRSTLVGSWKAVTSSHVEMLCPTPRFRTGSLGGGSLRPLTGRGTAAQAHVGAATARAAAPGGGAGSWAAGCRPARRGRQSGAPVAGRRSTDGGGTEREKHREAPLWPGEREVPACTGRTWEPARVLETPTPT